MKKSKIALIIIASILGIIIIGGYIFVRSIKNSGKPDYNQSVKIKGLKDEVTVYRDKEGVPHIYAKNEHDLYMVTGYISAQDRMWQMDLVRRVTLGRLSEILGDDYLSADVLFRSLQISQKSERTIKESSPEVIGALEAFAQGVNQYIEEDNLAFEFKVLGYKPDKWEPAHSANLAAYMAWDLSMAWSTELTLMEIKEKISQEKFNELIPDMKFQKNNVFSNLNNITLPKENLLTAYEKVREIAPEILNASNNWAVAGKKSVTGKPILANDMHLGLMIPGVWSQIHQNIEGKLNVTGVILPGQPFVIVGHNDNIAWGMTNVMLDDMDFYVETINPENENQYKFNGKWKDFEIKKETITNKEGIISQHILKFTHRGPVISDAKDIDDKVISMRWIGNENDNALRSIYLLNNAENWSDFRNAVNSLIAISQNIVYADINGNIGLQCCAGIPVREAAGYNVFPGDTSLYDWQGIVPFDSLPYIYNPECAYVLSANNRTIDESFPHYISSWFDLPYRADRIEEMLLEKEKLSVEDFKSIQNDQKSVLAREMVPILCSLIEKQTNLSIQEREFLNILKSWDFVYSIDSKEAVIFEEMYLILSKNIIEDETGPELFKKFRKLDLLTNYLIDRILKTGDSQWCDNINTPKNENFEDMVILSFKETINYLTQTYGNDISDLKWGDIHQLILEHPIGKVKIMDFALNLNRKYPVGGSYHTVSPYSYDFNSPYQSRGGASHRHIYTFDNFDNSQTIIPTGVSSVPGSDFYCNQTEMYIKGEYHQDLFSKKAVEEKAVFKAIFKP